jgi:probable rRNA maturation factor
MVSSDQSVIHLDIRRECSLWPEQSEALSYRAVGAVATVLNIDEPYEVSLILADDGFVRQLNKSYRGQDKSTNVLSFRQNLELDKTLLGDIVLAWQTVKHEADTMKIMLDHHLIHLVVHGFLHLLGYDHEDDDEADEMETLETRILESLSIPDPYKYKSPVPFSSINQPDH